VVPHEEQRACLGPPPKGHAKIVLSTNIAESSVTIPDVRYILDFGIVRKMVFDDDRAMQSLCNSWCSQATCEQRRGRCGRLVEGVIVHLFPRSLFSKMPAYAEPEILSVPLESIYLRCKVLLGHLGTPETLLADLLDPPPQVRISGASQNLRDLGAMDKDKVAPLGRIAVFMPTTIQLTKLIVVGWSLGVVADAIVIAAALSVQDVFVMASPQNARRPEDFPALLARNYTVRDKFSAGQYSEPIMYLKLYLDYIRNGARKHLCAESQLESCLASCAISTSRNFQQVIGLRDVHTSQKSALCTVNGQFKEHSKSPAGSGWRTGRNPERSTSLHFVAGRDGGK
jgi:HrpA-like RNA helicase